MTMKRNHLLLVGMGLELARHALLVAKIPQLLAGSGSSPAPQVLRLLSSPNLLFPIALFFLWRNAVKYETYRPLLLAGKALTLFASFMLLPAVLGIGVRSKPAEFSIILAFAFCVLVDAFSMAILVTMRKSEPAMAAEAGADDGPKIETVAED
jgi:hypothetical protein